MASGCTPPPRTVEVVGRVTHNGVPVEGAVVIFYGAKFHDDFPAAGGTDANGHYELRTYFGANDMPLGAIPNDYIVAIEKLKRPDVLRAQNRMRDVLVAGGDVKRYMREEAAHDLWPDGVPEGWPEGYIPAVNLYPKHIFDNLKLRAKVSQLERGVQLLPARYANPTTSGFHASVEPSDAPLIFDFELTGEIEEASRQTGVEIPREPAG